MKILSIVLILLGLILFGYSMTLNAYTNEKEYNTKYLSLCDNNRNKDFFELRKEYLTSKYRLEDYGLTMFLTGLFFVFVFNKGWEKFKTLRSKIWIIITGFLAVLTTLVGYVIDLSVEMIRGSFPHWADSLGIPLMAVPGLFLIFFIWFIFNLLGLKGNFKAGILVSRFKLDHLNLWYLIILIITLIIVITIIVTGYYSQIISGFLWIYFYLSLLVGTREAKLENERNSNQIIY